MNLSNPSKTGPELTVFDLPTAPLDANVASGIGHVADGTSGLHVINYVGFDTKGSAPTVSISASVTDLDPNTVGIQVSEGTRIPLRITAATDVQVGNVELLVDGTLTVDDVSAHFDLPAVVPPPGGGINLGDPLISGNRHGRSATWVTPGPGSVLDLFLVTAVVNGPANGSTINIQTVNGGSIDLRKVRQISDDPTGDTRFRSVIVFSDGTSSVINLSGLLAFLDSNPDIKSMIKTRNKGSVLFDSVNLTRNNTDLDLQ